MEKLCKNCKHWERIRYGSKKTGFCSSENLISLYSNTDDIKENQLGFDTFDMPQYYSGEDFGCIHFKQRENEKETNKN